LLVEDGKHNQLLKGFYQIDVEKLDNMEDEKLLMLAKNGILSLIYFHLASLSNIEKLINRL
jgi:hypothetical protein